MGHDLYIQARIKEKRTGRVISHGDSDDYAAEDDTGFFTGIRRHMSGNSGYGTLIKTYVRFAKIYGQPSQEPGTTCNYPLFGKNMA